MSNVLKNAWIHGDGNLSIRLTETGRLEIANPFEASYTGDPNDLFKSFQRLDKHRSTESSGLGLSIARSAVEKMGGTIKARIEDQTFTINIQLNRPDS